MRKLFISIQSIDAIGVNLVQSTPSARSTTSDIIPAVALNHRTEQNALKTHEH